MKDFSPGKVVLCPSVTEPESPLIYGMPATSAKCKGDKCLTKTNKGMVKSGITFSDVLSCQTEKSLRLSLDYSGNIPEILFFTILV
jgi:hypothetical protein